MHKLAVLVLGCACWETCTSCMHANVGVSRWVTPVHKIDDTRSQMHVHVRMHHIGFEKRVMVNFGIRGLCRKRRWHHVCRGAVVAVNLICVLTGGLYSTKDLLKLIAWKTPLRLC